MELVCINYITKSQIFWNKLQEEEKMHHTLQGVLPCSSFLATIIMANHNHMIEWADCKGAKVEEELTQIFSSGQWMIDSEVSQSQNEQVIHELAHCPGGGQMKSHSHDK